MLLTKSWPKEREQTDRSALDPRTVEFILSWKPMTGYLKFFGNPDSLCKYFLLIRDKPL